MSEDKKELLIEELQPRRIENKVLIRREMLKRLLMRGYHAQEEYAKILKVSRCTIQRDLEIVQKELKNELKTENLENLLNDFKLQNQGAYEEAWETYKKSKHPSARVGALRLIHEFQQDKIKILQSLGIIRELAPLERKAVIVKFIDPEWMKNGTGGDTTSRNESELPAVCDTAEVSQQPDKV